MDVPVSKAWKQEEKRCAVEGCRRDYYAKGYCKAHYDRARRGADPEKLVPKQNPLMCEAQGCHKDAAVNGLCRHHYMKDYLST